jgi:hypothetical protein
MVHNGIEYGDMQVSTYLELGLGRDFVNVLCVPGIVAFIHCHTGRTQMQANT